ncbi:hypothetical protein H0H81_007356, partial [Sphagnurus paluster]
ELFGAGADVANDGDVITSVVAVSLGPPPAAPASAPAAAATAALSIDDDQTDEDVDEEPVVALRHLRLRDYNPYAVSECAREAEDHESRHNSDHGPGRYGGHWTKGKGKGVEQVSWGTPRVVTEPTITNVRGVFQRDVTSRLPYVEVVSAEKFAVTDVMMDDSRLLLLKRGASGKLKRVDVLTM